MPKNFKCLLLFVKRPDSREKNQCPWSMTERAAYGGISRRKVSTIKQHSAFTYTKNWFCFDNLTAFCRLSLSEKNNLMIKSLQKRLIKIKAINIDRILTYCSNVLIIITVFYCYTVSERLSSNREINYQLPRMKMTVPGSLTVINRP